MNRDEFDNQMGRHAYLIICHNNFEQLRILLSLLDDERNDIYIHVDKKSGMFPKQELINSVRKSGIHFVQRINVNWGGFSQIHAELILLKEALKTGYSYYHLLSGVDLPIKSQDEIHAYFKENAGKEFLQFDDKDMKFGGFKGKVKYYYPLQELIGHKRALPYRIMGKIQKILVVLQSAFGIDRLKNLEVPVFKGANWFSITHAMAQYVLQEEQFILEHFKSTMCADEIFLHTIAKKSPYKDNIVDESLRLIDWDRGNPYVFRVEDYEELKNSRQLFARKFDLSADCEIIDKVVHELCGK